jgi:hypothetical protein
MCVMRVDSGSVPDAAIIGGTISFNGSMAVATKVANTHAVGHS